MSEQLIRTEPFENKAEAIVFATEVMERMRSCGYVAEPVEFGDISTDVIELIVENIKMKKVYGIGRIIFGHGQVAIAADGNDFARNNIKAIAQALGLSDEDAASLANQAEECETGRGKSLMMAIIPNSDSCADEVLEYV